jgi:hypothetical protein
VRTVLVTARPEASGHVRVTVAVRDAGAAAWPAPVTDRVVEAAALRAHTVALGPATTGAAITAAGEALMGELVGPGEPAWTGPARLLLDVPDDLQSLPWEVLRAQPRWLFSRPVDPAARYRPRHDIPEPLCAPVEVLVVVGDTDPALKAQEEVAAIYAAISDLPACWNVEVLFEPTMAALRAAFVAAPPHVLHFIGHGVVDDGRPVLRIDDADGGRWSLDADFVTGALAGVGACPPRLVVLNGCRTTADGAVRGVGDAFLAEGSLAAVTNQGNVEAAASVAFTARFYAALAQAEPVDVAAARARNDLQFDRQTYLAHEWALPVLTVAVEPQEALRVVRPGNPRAILDQAGVKTADMVRRMVDRCDSRRTVWRWLARPDAPLLLVSGQEATGKSAIAEWTVVTSRVHGTPAARAEFEHRGPAVDWRRFLRVLADAVEQQAGPAAVAPAAAFRDVLDGRAPAPVELLRPSDQVDESDEAYRQFWLFFGAAVPDGQFVLVVDCLEPLQELPQFVRQLVVPVVQARPVRLRLVVVDRAFGQKLPPTAGDHMAVGPFAMAQIERLVQEYCVRIRGQSVYAPPGPTDQQWRTLVTTLHEWAQQRNRPDKQPDVLARELFMAEELARLGAGVGLRGGS